MSGTLYICGTPIGNLEDITLRVLRILKEVDLIAAEDTRVTHILLAHYGIKTPLTRYHGWNEKSKTPFLVQELQSGKNIALVCDAGMPTVSDPGYVIIRNCIQAEISIVTVPGPTALAAALSISGFPADRFVFKGFLSPKGSKRWQRLGVLCSEERTIVLYESPHRLLRTLVDLLKYLGDCEIAVCRELTKKFEEVRRGKISEVMGYYKEKRVRGELTLVIGPQKRL